MRVAAAIVHFLRSLVRELSDENAYHRYLASSGEPNSRSAWEHFTKHRYGRKFGNPKCC
jgi:hypothetical protein